ncbi:MAG TPA: hypothetical protein DER01_02810 [Phycisphaerales bacterium]|nr:hypothetical protein [Phycisphaerales bacterium]
MKFGRLNHAHVACLAVILLLSLHCWVQAASAPTILFDSWNGHADNDYMKQLTEAGFVVDAIKHEELTWDRLKQYNVLVMLDFPEENKVKYNPGYGPAKGPNFQQTYEMIERFLKLGGGVMVNLIQHRNRPQLYDSVQKLLGKWGASRPMQTVDLPQHQYVLHPRLRHQFQFYFTDNVQPSPVSQDVKGVWYPQNQMWCTGGPITVDKDWTVVLRAPHGSVTKPLAFPQKRIHADDDQRIKESQERVKEPALYAIREFGGGRLALFHAHSNHHWQSGRQWLHDGVMLDKGLQGRPSDFGILLSNTWKWLASPSLQSGKLGGAKVEADRWKHRFEREDDPVYQRLLVNEPKVNLSPQWTPRDLPCFKGMVGPQTVHSGGQATVEQYAKVARQKGLGFVIFLEDFTRLNRQSLTRLVAQCKQYSSSDLLLIAGYRIPTNLGNTQFHFGFDPVWPDKKHLSADGKLLIIQPKAKDGRYKSADIVTYILASRKGGKNSSGFFGFREPMKQGGMAVTDLRIYSMVGLMLYREGQLVEDMTDQYLTTNACTMTGTPVAIHLIDTHEAMADAVDQGLAMTYAKARNLSKLWKEALAWNSQFMNPDVYVSNGPMIEHWTDSSYRKGTYAAEPYVASRVLVGATLEVTSKVGLKEICIYDGDRLFRRYLPGGKKTFQKRLFFSGSLQRTMSVVATDKQENKAVSFPLRGWNDGGPSIIFCADHVNEGEMKLFHGPGWTRYNDIPYISELGEKWDGMVRVAHHPLLDFGNNAPRFKSDIGRQDMNLCQTPMLELSDDNVLRCRSISRGVMAPSVKNFNAWRGYGPIEPTPLVDLVGIFTQFSAYQTGKAVGHGPMGVEGGPLLTMYEQTNTFKKDMTLTESYFSHQWREPITGDIDLVVGEGDRIIEERDISTDEFDNSKPKSHIIDTGQWFAAISPVQANAMLMVNRGSPLVLSVSGKKTQLVEALPRNGLVVKAHQQRRVSWLTCYWPMDITIGDTDTLLKWIRYYQKPDGLQIIQGKQLDGFLGLIDLQSEDGAVELKLPQAPDDLDVNLPFRVHGLNPRYSAILWQKTGYVGEGRYGSERNRFRNVAVDWEGHAYFPVYAAKAKLHHWVVGQPVIADEQGAELFIEVVCLKDAQKGASPQWHVSINNPTDQVITTKIRQVIKLPGLNLYQQKISIKPGVSVTLIHGDQK